MIATGFIWFFWIFRKKRLVVVQFMPECLVPSWLGPTGDFGNVGSTVEFWQLGIWRLGIWQ